jgi:CMP-N,N'-diacetyllegionaminic acid synthase
LRILALIAARGGSKRVPGKNSRLLAGRPLIVWSIEVVKEVPYICDILVSTDDPSIAEIAGKAGALVPWLRPAELATDSATSVDVSLHALNWYENQNGKVDGLLLLQPTSPFRSRATVLRGVELFRINHRRAILGVSPAVSHPMLCFKIENGSLRPFVEGKGVQSRSQELPPAYELNGAFYLVTPEDLRARLTFYGENALPLLIDDPEERIDIDTERDWSNAEFVAGRKHMGSKIE